jgi:hypothetical protein
MRKSAPQNRKPTNHLNIFDKKRTCEREEEDGVKK